MQEINAQALRLPISAQKGLFCGKDFSVSLVNINKDFYLFYFFILFFYKTLSEGQMFASLQWELFEFLNGSHFFLCPIQELWFAHSSSR